MTNERAKSELMQIYMSLSEEKKKALDMAIKALEYDDAKYHEEHGEVIVDKGLWEDAKKALEQEPCEDVISRKALLKLMGEEPFNWTDSDKELQEVEDYRNFRNMVEQLPPVTPQPKTGRWFIDERPESDREVICSNCEQPIFKYHKMDFDYRPKFCPNCGAKMVEPQESEDKE